MKKYLVLLIIPLLFFSIGCNDDDNDDSIPISEYPELILGHWSLNSTKFETTLNNVQIDSIYGNENIISSEIIFDTIINNGYGISLYSSLYEDYSPPFCILSPNNEGFLYNYRTFKFDETITSTLILTDLNDNLEHPSNSLIIMIPFDFIPPFPLNPNPNYTEEIYSLNQDIIQINNFPIKINQISNESLQLESVLVDTVEIDNDTYVLRNIKLIENFSKIESIPEY